MKPSIGSLRNLQSEIIRSKISNLEFPYNLLMGSSAPAHAHDPDERSSSWLPIVFGVVLVVIVVVIASLLLRTDAKIANRPRSLRRQHEVLRHEDERGGKFCGGHRHLSRRHRHQHRRQDRQPCHGEASPSRIRSARSSRPKTFPCVFSRPADPTPRRWISASHPWPRPRASLFASPSSTSPPTGTTSIRSCG